MSERILVIQTAFIGDAILTLPMIQALKGKFPDHLIDVIAIPSTAQIFEHSKYVNRVIVLDKRGTHSALLNQIRFISEIRKSKYLMIYSPHRSFRTSLIVLLSRVRETHGFDNASLSHVYKHLVKYDREAHEVERNLNLVEGYCSDKDWRILPEILIGREAELRIDEYLRVNGIQNYIVIAPGSVWATKRYPEEYFITVIQYLIEEGYDVILSGSGGDSRICDRIASAFGGKVHNSAGEFSLIESTALISKSKLLICNDSAPTHMALCAGIPVLTLYCSTVPSFGFYPYSKNSRYLSYDELNCKPCGIHGHPECPIKTFECGMRLTGNLVIRNIKEMLSL